MVECRELIGIKPPGHREPGQMPGEAEAPAHSANQPRKRAPFRFNVSSVLSDNAPLISSGRSTSAAGGEEVVISPAFIVAPIADPDEAFAFSFQARRAEQSYIGCLMPDVHASSPAAPAIDLRQRFAECEDGIVAIEVEVADRAGVTDCAMMGVVKEQRKTPPPRPQLAKRSYQPGLVPFVHDDGIRPGDARFKVGIGVIVDGPQLRIRGAKSIECARTMVPQEIIEAPASARLEGNRVVTQSNQLTQHTA